MATQPSTTNVVPLRSYKPPAPPVALQSVEMALSLAILSALSIGSKRDRKLFQLVGWELDRLTSGAPDSVMLAKASAIYSRVRDANHGR